jgi:hypothetical protein
MPGTEVQDLICLEPRSEDELKSSQAKAKPGEPEFLP